MEAHLVPSRSRTQVQRKHRVLIPIPDTVTATKIMLFKQKKKKNGNNETQKHRNWIWDHISETAFLGLQSQDHGNRDFILNITEVGSHFYNYQNGIKFLRSWNRDCIFDITGVGTAFLRSRKWHFKLTKGDKIIKTYN